MRNIAVGLVLTSIFILASFSAVGLRDYKIRKVVIDAGHGGRDPGTHGSKTVEKDISLNIALQVGGYIEENMPDVEVIYTRDADTYPSLDKRARIANEADADLFISIHCNFNYNSTIHGTESYVMGFHKDDENFNVAKRENSVILLEANHKEVYEDFDPNSPESYILFNLYQDAHQENSLKIAQKIENQFKSRVNRRSRGVKQAEFIVLWKTGMPSVLVETGYLSNSNEENYLSDEYGQSLIASGIWRAFRDYRQDIEFMN